MARLLEIIARDQVPERPGRREPRAVKRRPKPYQKLNRPRHLMKEMLHRSKYRKNGPLSKRHSGLTLPTGPAALWYLALCKSISMTAAPPQALGSARFMHVRACKRYYGLMRRSERTPSSLGLLGFLWPVFALAGRSPHLPFFAGSYYSYMLRPLPRWLTEFFDGSSLGHARPSPFLSRVRLFPKIPSSLASEKEAISGRTVYFVMLRPACWLERLASPCRHLSPPTRPPVYGKLAPARVSPNLGLL